MRDPVYCMARPAYWSALYYHGTPSSPITVIFIFQITAWELLQLKQACLIGGNIHKILMNTVTYKWNIR
jgi:hypothetical protein